MKYTVFIVLLLISFYGWAQQEAIKEVQIGEQIWMAENLNVDRFSNGDLIKEAKTYEDWKRAEVNRRPAWCYYNNDSTNGPQYGKLYNFFAINDPRGLAPKNWHIPKDEEWETLIEFLGGEKKAGKTMKSTEGWEKNGNGNNKSGFNGFPGGFRQHTGEFHLMGVQGNWWLYKGGNIEASHSFIFLSNSSSDAKNNYYFATSAFSVRCVKNK